MFTDADKEVDQKEKGAFEQVEKMERMRDVLHKKQAQYRTQRHIPHY